MLLHFIFAGIGSFLLLPLLFILPLRLTKTGIFLMWFGSFLFTFFSFVTLEAFPVWQAGLMVLALMLAVSYLLEGRLSTRLFRASAEYEAHPEIEEPLSLKMEEEQEVTFEVEQMPVYEERNDEPETKEKDIAEVATFVQPSWTGEKPFQKTEATITEEVEKHEEDIEMDFLHKRLKEAGSFIERQKPKEDMSDSSTKAVQPHYMSEIDELLFDEHPEQDEEKPSKKPLEKKEGLEKDGKETLKPTSRYNDYFDEETEDVWGEDDIIEIKPKGEGQQ